MKNQEKDLKNEDTGSTRRKLTKEELTALCRRMEKHVQKFGEYMRMVEEERKKAEQEKNQKKKTPTLPSRRLKFIINRYTEITIGYFSCLYSSK